MIICSLIPCKIKNSSCWKKIVGGVFVTFACPVDISVNGLVSVPTCCYKTHSQVLAFEMQTSESPSLKGLEGDLGERTASSRETMVVRN